MIMKHLIVHFELVDMGDEIIAVPVGEGAEKIHGVLKLNHSGAEILEYLEKGATQTEIVEELSNKYENDHASLEADVCEVIDSLEKIGLIS